MRFRLAHLPQLLAVAHEENLLEQSQARRVEALELYYDSGFYEASKSRLGDYMEELTEEKDKYKLFEGAENMKVSSNRIEMLRKDLFNFCNSEISTVWRDGRVYHNNDDRGCHASVSLRNGHLIPPSAIAFKVSSYLCTTFLFYTKRDRKFPPLHPNALYSHCCAQLFLCFVPIIHP